MSKAALNMVTRSLSVGLRDSNIVFVTLNPGYVDTDMNDHNGYLPPAESAESMANIVANLSMKDTGKFYNADKQFGEFELPTARPAEIYLACICDVPIWMRTRTG
ncbi:unnamed protein product [Phytophthora fragariaefolia]|uniref:Unnamed protein product n=1 Tax=Phytophthora fragariaefolia TaxID=1490495 RepID=A0A9W6XYF5_9STRA|nr:unnamed protein product [Phytophthora fragariaefolia]